MKKPVNMNHMIEELKKMLKQNDIRKTNGKGNDMKRTTIKIIVQQTGDCVYLDERDIFIDGKGRLWKSNNQIGCRGLSCSENSELKRIHW